MRLIPGNTKVQIEIFRGVSLLDMLVAAIEIILLALLISINLPFKWILVYVHVIISALLLARIDKEPNYMYIFHIIRHLGYRRKFDKAFTDKNLVEMAHGEDSAYFNMIFGEEDKEEEEKAAEEEQAPLSKAELKAKKKAEKAERKADDKLLKSKKLTKEEEDAIWLKRAQQSAAKKEAKKTKKNSKSKSAHNPGKNGSKSDWEDIEKLSSFTDIKDGFISFHGKYYGAVLEIPSVEFRFFSSFRRSNSIENALGSVLRSMKSDFCMNLVKIERPISYDKYEEDEYKRIEELRKSYEQGFMNDEEIKSRLAIIYDRIERLKDLEENNKIVVPFYYLVFFDNEKNQLNTQVDRAIANLAQGEMKAQRLNDKELALFLKYSNALDFDEKTLDNIRPEDYAKWAMPDSVEFCPRVSIVNGIATHNFRVVTMPNMVPDAWLASLMTYPSTKVMVKMQPMDSSKAIKAIDTSLSELRATANAAKTDSEALAAQTHIETLQSLLTTLQNDNETLLDINIYVTAYDIEYTEKNPKLPKLKYDSFRCRIAEMKKVVKRTWSEEGFRMNNMEFNQAIAYIGSQVSGYDPMAKKGRGIPSNTVAAMFPWIFPHIMDSNGIQMGASDGVPVFINFFTRNSERVNSNMVIVGKSGSGKSYATKALLSNLAADDAKIFVLDPENEYTELAENLHGKFINVATNQYGRLNPFHIITSLEDDVEGTATNSYAIHLQFLEEFFKQILPDCDKDSLEYLNTLVDRIYKRHGISPETDLSTLKPEDYPIFDDLYDEILQEFQKTKNEYIRTMLRTLMNYISKFSEGGRNAVIWNGPSSITTEENFTVFNFQSLLSNRNSTVANAQMLLILKYIDNEIIKNRDYNIRYGLNRKVVVVIDEAHVFIDAKYPVALDFMFQLAKRIRKYNGMQIVITQNIKDFVGSEEIARKSTAIINACQYSFIFALSPNDMGDLCKLYEKAGGINESEQEQIVQAPRGQAFTVMSPTSRSSFAVTVPKDTAQLFSDPTYQNPYFEGEGGDENWNEFIGDSGEKRAAVMEKKAAEKRREESGDGEIKKVSVSFTEVSEEEMEAEENVPAELNRGSVGFSETTAEDEDLAALMSEISEVKKNADTAATAVSGQPAQYIPPVQIVQPVQQIPVQPAVTSSKTEEILAGLVDKLGSANMLDEIRKAVREEVELQVAKRMEEAPKAAEMPASFASAPAESEDSVTSLGNIFDFASLAGEDTTESKPEEQESAYEETSNEDRFDVLAFLAQESEKQTEKENASVVTDFINSTDTKLTITFEQLMQYNKECA